MFVSRDPHHRADNVGGNWHKSRQPVGRRTVSEHRRRRTVGRRYDIRYLPVEIVGKSLSQKPRVSDRCTISTSTQSILDDTPQRRPVTSSVHARLPEIFSLQSDQAMHCFQCSHPTVTIGISARPLEATLMSSGSTLSRAALRAALRVIGGPSHPTRYLGHRRMGVKQGRDHLIEARSHHRSIVTQGIIFAHCRTDEALAETGRLKIRLAKDSNEAVKN